MKKLWFSLCLFFSFHCWGQSVPVIEAFSSIQLNEDKTVTITPYHPNMWSFSSREDKIILHKGEEYSFGDGHHAYGSVVYKGVKDGQLVFEEMFGFNAISFGGNVTEEKKEKLISPYTKKEFSSGREAEILKWMTYNEENKEEIARLIKILGNQNELLWWNRYNKDYVDFLLQNGADINAVDEKGETILFSLALRYPDSQVSADYCSRKRKLIPFLLSKGINIQHKNNDGKTVLQLLKETISVCNKHFTRHASSEELDCDCLPVVKKLLEGVDPILADEKTCQTWPDFEMVKNYRDEQYCVPKCRPFYFRPGPGDFECMPCNAEYEMDTTPKECSKCSNRKIKDEKDGVGVCAKTGNICPKDMFYGEEDCIPCDDTSPINTTEEECNKCSNRKMTGGEWNRCVLKECPKGYFKTGGNWCTPCDELEVKGYVEPDECFKCSNRELYGQECVLKECPNGHFRNKEGACIKCGVESAYSWSLLASKEECAKCENTISYNGYCILPQECPANHLQGIDGKCFHCEDLKDISTTAKECDKCPNRKYVDGKCVPKECPADHFKNKAGSCYECKSLKFYQAETTFEECSKCPNREYKEGWCKWKRDLWEKARLEFE